MLSKVKLPINKILFNRSNKFLIAKSFVTTNSVALEEYKKPNSSLITFNYKSFTNYEKITRDEGLRKYMKDLYYKSGNGFVTTLTVSMVAPFLGALSSIPPVYLMIGWVGNIGLSFYSILKMNKLEVKTITKENGYYEVPNKDKEFWYKVFTFSNGLIIAPAVGAALLTAPHSIPMATFSTAAIFGGATYVALKQSDLSLVKYQAPLIGGVCGLIAGSVIQIGGHYMGFYQMANTMDMVITGASTLIFTGLVAADTQRAIQDYQDGKLDSVQAATELLLDASNLFLDMLKIMTRLTGNSKDD